MCSYAADWGHVEAQGLKTLLPSTAGEQTRLFDFDFKRCVIFLLLSEFLKDAIMQTQDYAKCPKNLHKIWIRNSKQEKLALVSGFCHYHTKNFKFNRRGQ